MIFFKQMGISVGIAIILGMSTGVGGLLLEKLYIREIEKLKQGV